MDTPLCFFLPLFTKGNNLVTFCLLPRKQSSSEKGSTLKRKTFLLEEKILSFKGSISLRREAEMKIARVTSLENIPIDLN